MGMKPVITGKEAAMYVTDGMTVTATGFVSSCMPETLTRALEERFLETGAPKDLTLFFAAAQGWKNGSGADHFAHEGMLKRVIGGHYNFTPAVGQLIADNKIEAYNFPQGTLAQMYRDMAAGKIGTFTHVGLNTFADPRVEGGKLNEKTTEDIVEVVNIGGKEVLWYKPVLPDVAFIRGTYADEAGNVSVEKEIGPLNAFAVAAATHNNGGKVIVQVEQVVAKGSLNPQLVKIPGILVDAIVVAEQPGDQDQCFGVTFDGSMTGAVRIPVNSAKVDIPLDAKKMIGRRGMMELEKDKIVNLGVGVPEYVAASASEENIGDWMTLTVEAGGIGGISQGGAKFGGAANAQAIVEEHSLFDLYDGGGIDLAYLGLAQVDADGNINVSKFSGRVTGCGGFVNITQNARKVFFCGTFTAGGFKCHAEDGKLVIDQEGKQKKFVKNVEQITFSGVYARKVGQPVKYITERAVFELKEDGIHLIEVAPGIDVKTQVLDLMDFEPIIDGEVKLMDSRIFKEGPMNIQG